MADYFSPDTVRASSSAFAWGDMIFTDYASGCLRKILLQSRGVEKPFLAKYTDVGALNEARHENNLQLAPGMTYKREVEFVHVISDRDKGLIYLKGHADFVHYNIAGRAVCVDELKSVQSKNKRLQYIRKGVWNTENLAQLVCYMSAFGVTHGRLIYTFWEADKLGDMVATEERILLVTIDDFGRILVDSKATKYTVYDLYAHQSQAADALKGAKVMQRPLNWDAPFVSPCAYCAFAKACDAYDNCTIESSEAFVNFAKEIVK